jgi:CubicO group peptidase (beta-lactamase class C family)
MYLLKTIIFPLAFLSCIVACSQPGAKKQDKLSSEALAPGSVTQVANQSLSPLYIEKYQQACSGFFDSLLLSRGSFNGSILVAKDGNIVYEKYAGYNNPHTRKDSLKANSAFHLASVSKTFTAMAVLKLWENGQVSLEDSLGKFFPGFPYKGITVKMLLNHRSGLPNYVHYLEGHGWDKRKMATNTDVLNSLYQMHVPLEFPSGKHFSYCNTNYALLALVIEKVSGQSYPDFIKKTIFTPLQMNDSYVFSLQDTGRAMPSFKYNNREYPMEFLDEVYGDKNIYSTVRDMLKWDQALYAGQMFKQSTLDSAFSGYSFEKQGKRNYGLGWRMTFLDNGKKLLYHNGWWHGNNAAFIRLVDEKATIIVLGNKFNKKIYASKHLSDLFGNYMQNGNTIEDAEGSVSSTGGGEQPHVRKAVVVRKHHRHKHR